MAPRVEPCSEIEVKHFILDHPLRYSAILRFAKCALRDYLKRGISKSHHIVPREWLDCEQGGERPAKELKIC